MKNQNSASTPASRQTPDGLCAACPMHRLRARLAHEVCTYDSLLKFVENRRESAMQDLLIVSGEAHLPEGPPEDIEPVSEENVKKLLAHKPVLEELIVTQKDGEPTRIWAVIEIRKLSKMLTALLLLLADEQPAGDLGDTNHPGADELAGWKTRAYIEQHLPASARAKPGTRRPNAVRMNVLRLREEFQKRGLDKEFIESTAGNKTDESMSRLRVRRAGGKSCDDAKSP